MKPAKLGRKNKKGVFEGLSNAALSMVILTMTIGIGSLILQQFNTTAGTPNASNPNQALPNAATNVIGQGISSLGTFGNFFPVIITAVIGVALFILILAGLSRFRGGSSEGF